MDGAELITIDNKRLYYRTRAVGEHLVDFPMTIMPQHGVHADRNDVVFCSLNDAGFRFHCHDLRGHGEFYLRNGGYRGDIISIDLCLEDLSQMLLTVDAEEKIGNSMGGLISILFVINKEKYKAAIEKLSGIILTSPALGIPISSWKIPLAMIGGIIAPQLSVPAGIKPKLLSRNPEAQASLEADPKCLVGWINLRTVVEMARAIKPLNPPKDATRTSESISISISIFILHGDKDAVTSPQSKPKDI